MKEETKKWIRQAKRDIKKSKDNFNIKNYDVSAFLTQQSIEKGLKALILEKENKLIKTHDLNFLAERVKLPENLKEICKELTLMYTYTRYPDAEKVKKIKEKAEKYLGSGKEILRWIKKQL